MQRKNWREELKKQKRLYSIKNWLFEILTTEKNTIFAKIRFLPEDEKSSVNTTKLES